MTSPQSTPHDIQTLLRLAATLSIPPLEAQILLAHVLRVTRSYLFTHPLQPVESSAVEQLLLLVKRRQAGEPIAYLVGTKEFWSLPLKVSNAVLIPRPETELLVETIFELMSDPLNKISKDKQAIRILDLGTGSGAIALALASEHPEWQIIASDRSAAALDIAKENAKNLAIRNVEFYLSDWFSGFQQIKNHPENAFHIIVSNPPYIDVTDQHLNQGDLRYEPKQALVAGEQGLADIQIIIHDAPQYLRENGWLLLEHGYDQGKAVVTLMQSFGFEKIKTIPDLAGLDRITIGYRPKQKRIIYK